MFTGIVEEIGKIVEVDDLADFRTIRVAARNTLEDLAQGASIAVNGVCLTVRSIFKDGFTAELSRETLDRTTLNDLGCGVIVNLERPMGASSRFGGHIVQGHVDETGLIRNFSRLGDNWNLEVEFPEASERYVVEKGSIAIDGISLTIARLGGSGRFSVDVIPHTFDHTNLQTAKSGDRVNLEYDVIAKYVETLLKPYAIRKY